MGYAVVGKENLAIARLLSIAAWMVGALPLMALARRLSEPPGAIVALSTYLFLPYGVVASRAFQPDALMTSASLFALLAGVRSIERHSVSRRLAAAGAIGIAAVIKPMSVFLTIPGFIGFAIARHGWRVMLQRSVWSVIVLGLFPAVLIYGYSTAFGTFARDQMRLRFVPALIPTPFFWGGLWTQIARVLGPTVVAATAAGTIVAERRTRVVLTALWAGYLAFAIAFTYHMPTHDYYHLPYIVLAAFACASLAQRVQRQLDTRGRSGLGFAIVTGAIALLIGGGVARAIPQLGAGDDGRIAMYEQIGALAEHQTRVLFLDTAYGYPLMYYGQVSGDSWPTSDDLAAEALGGAAPITADERFARDFADYAPTFFIVTDLRSLEDQPDLERWLSRHADVVRRTADYHIYRLGSGDGDSHPIVERAPSGHGSSEKPTQPLR